MTARLLAISTEALRAVARDLDVRAVTQPTPPADHDRLLTPLEVGNLFRVDPKTVTRWANAGRLPFVRTLGGHHRFRESIVRDLLAQDGARS